MMDTPKTLAALLDPENAPAGHGPWRPVQRKSVWLTDDDGCSLLVDSVEVADLLNLALAAAPVREEGEGA